ncbi:hypothetical protein Drorol1_Dr00011778 [Drosera rotundifolia]
MIILHSGEERNYCSAGTVHVNSNPQIWFSARQFCALLSSAHWKILSAARHVRPNLLLARFGRAMKLAISVKAEHRDYDRRRSPARYYGSTRDSPTPPRGYDRSLSRSHDYRSPSPRKKHYSRFASPAGRKPVRERCNCCRSRVRSSSRSPPYRTSRIGSPSRRRCASPRRITNRLVEVEKRGCISLVKRQFEQYGGSESDVSWWSWNSYG